MKSCLLILILFSVILSGCISSEQEKGDPEAYELPGLNDSTIFYLNSSSVQVIENIVNATSTKIVVGDSAETIFSNPVAIDYSGNSVLFNISKEVIFGKSYVRFDFNSPFSGFVAYTQSDGQDFIRPLTKNGSVRMVLPVNFTTGSRFLGIANPVPDAIMEDASGREVLIWKDPYPAHQSVSVKYYHKSAPARLGYFFIFLLSTAFLIFGYYYFSMRTLKKKRMLMERVLKK